MANRQSCGTFSEAPGIALGCTSQCLTQDPHSIYPMTDKEQPGAVFEI
jgi:hypothetical protein